MLDIILPTSGYYCVAIIAGTGFRHKFFADLTQAEEYALQEDARGETVYIAQATYNRDAVDANKDNRENRRRRSDPEWRSVRTKANALYLRSFYLDIDCGAGKPYPTQREGAQALKDMVAASGLPMPIVVSSGGGLYAYWAMQQNVPTKQWCLVADVFKQVVAHFGLDADPAITANAAGVLRPVGSTNRKPGRPERTVTKLGKDAPSYDFREFATLLGAAAKKSGVRTTIAAPPKDQDIWGDYQIYQNVVSRADDAASKCGQLAAMRDTKGDMPEPLWYACIGLLRYTENGATVIHEWSKGHPDYDQAETDQKIQQHEQSGAGPTTCAHFGSTEPKNCIGCPHKNKIKSPIVLGRPSPIAASLPSNAVDQPPAPFTRAKDGLYVQDGDVSVRFYDRDLYPIRIAHDLNLGYEVITLKHCLPHDGWHEITLRTSLVNDARGLLTALYDNHVHVVGKKEKAIMCAYIEGYAKHLQNKRALSQLVSQMGWARIRGMDSFIVGEKIYYSDGTVENAALSGSVPEAVKAYRCEGSLDAWVEATEQLATKGAEPLAFALIAGAFGSPLMKFTGYDGAMICLEGKSGVGKTLVSRWVQSAYGDQNQLMMLRDDTRNSLVSRLGVCGSLPMTIDEITNIDPEELSDLVYRITQGRDKARLTKSAVERANINHWQTLAIVSSNASLAEKLAALKNDASAEINRIFEYVVRENDALGAPECTQIYRTIIANYGHVGQAYAGYIVQHVPEHQERIDQLTTHVMKEVNGKSEDRFWCAIVAAAIYGGAIAAKLNLIRFDVKRILTWAIGQIRMMQSVRSDVIMGSDTILSQFLDDYAANCIIVEQEPGQVKSELTVRRSPQGPLIYRVELHTKLLFISRPRLREYFNKKRASYRQTASMLQAGEALLDSSRRKALGSGTMYGGGQQQCWCVDLAAPCMGGIGRALLEDHNPHAAKVYSIAQGRRY